MCPVGPRLDASGAVDEDFNVTEVHEVNMAIIAPPQDRIILLLDPRKRNLPSKILDFSIF